MKGNIAVFAGKIAAKISRATGRGNGGMIGGKIAMALDKKIMAKLASGKKVVLVTGTNGKSTTTKMVCAALKTKGKVATNDLGDNMYAGVVSAMMNDIDSEYVVLEVDELHLETVARETNPAAIILLNLTADQLDRVGEVSLIEKKVRAGVNVAKNAFVVANCDDPMVSSAAWDNKDNIWCACATNNFNTCLKFSRTNGFVKYIDNKWVAIADNGEISDFARPKPDWYYDETGVLCGPDGIKTSLNLKLPGIANRMNAMQAIACATRLGVAVDEAVKAVESVDNVAGRYAIADIEGRLVHMLLAKNPAGWSQAISMIAPDAKNIVIGVNGMVGDGVDLSWIWDIDFSILASKVNDDCECKIYATGKRCADLSVLLSYLGIKHEMLGDPVEAILKCPTGSVELLANYTSFHDVKHVIASRGYKYL